MGDTIAECDMVTDADLNTVFSAFLRRFHTPLRRLRGQLLTCVTTSALRGARKRIFTPISKLAISKPPAMNSRNLYTRTVSRIPASSVVVKLNVNFA
jgi:hypothetical protein